MQFSYSNGTETKTWTGCNDGDIYYNGSLVCKIFYNGTQVYQRYSYNYHSDVRTCYRNVNCSHSESATLTTAAYYNQYKDGALWRVAISLSTSGSGANIEWSGVSGSAIACGCNGFLYQVFTSTSVNGFGNSSSTSGVYNGRVTYACVGQSGCFRVSYGGHYGNWVSLSSSNTGGDAGQLNASASGTSYASWTETQSYTVDCSYYSWDAM